MFFAKIPRHTRQNAITEGDLECILTRNCEGTEQLQNRINITVRVLNSYGIHLIMEDKLMLETGIKGRQEVVVSDANSAKTMGSGTLDVFATPAMTALMEKTAWMSVADQLDEGCGTVGTLLNVTHDAPTPLGMTVWCETELVEVDGRRLVFDVAAYDAKGKIGGGRHERFIIQNEKFQAKANKKAEQ